MHVKVVNSYAAASLAVPVRVVRRVDLPTEGKPTRPTRVSPDLLTSKPRPASLEPEDLPHELVKESKVKTQDTKVGILPLDLF